MAQLRRTGDIDVQGPVDEALTGPFGGQSGQSNQQSGLGNLTSTAQMSEQAPDDGQASRTAQNRAGETPRERLQGDAGMGGNAAAEVRPRTPTPMAGTSFTQASGGAESPLAQQGGVVPFQPMDQSGMMGDMSTGMGLTSPRLRGLYGSRGGLQGGGLGVPLDPQSNETSDPISTLMQLISQKRGL